MSFFGVPLSGLIASQDQLQSVSNNLANLDTVGFKDQTTSFSDIFAQSSLVNGANNPISTGLGVTPSQTTSDFTDGAQSATGVSSNMALSGNGFFVTQSADGKTAYTRAGDFTSNSTGQLVTPSGELVMGYPGRQWCRLHLLATAAHADWHWVCRSCLGDEQLQPLHQPELHFCGRLHLCQHHADL